MYSLIQVLPLKRLWQEQAPSILMAGIIAELFYKFHSFSLECIAFLATWFIIDGAIQWLRPKHESN